MATKRTLIGNIKGPKGDTGAQGPQGATGPGATIEVGTVSTTAYGNTAQVTNSGTATAAVLDFVIPQGKPGEQTTKMSSLTLDTVTASTEDYPIPATGDTGSIAWGKVIKFFNDAKTAIASKINITDIVNNLTSTATNKPLSAAQGKALNDAIGNTNNNVSNLTTAVAQIRTIKKCTVNLANSNVITNNAGEAYCYYINNSSVIVFMTLAFKTTTARNSGQAVFFLSVDGRDILIKEPYNLPCMMSDGNMRFAGYDFNDTRYITTPITWPANTEARYSGTFYATLS